MMMTSITVKTHIKLHAYYFLKHMLSFIPHTVHRTTSSASASLPVFFEPAGVLRKIIVISPNEMSGLSFVRTRLLHKNVYITWCFSRSEVINFSFLYFWHPLKKKRICSTLLYLFTLSRTCAQERDYILNSQFIRKPKKVCKLKLKPTTKHNISSKEWNHITVCVVVCWWYLYKYKINFYVSPWNNAIS